jgi:hypothetical protein
MRPLIIRLPLDFGPGEPPSARQSAERWKATYRKRGFEGHVKRSDGSMLPNKQRGSEGMYHVPGQMRAGTHSSSAVWRTFEDIIGKLKSWRDGLAPAQSTEIVVSIDFKGVRMKLTHDTHAGRNRSVSQCHLRPGVDRQAQEHA